VGYPKKSKPANAPPPDHSPEVKKDPVGGFWYIVDSENELEVGDRAAANQKALNRAIENDWPAMDEISKLGTQKLP